MEVLEKLQTYNHSHLLDVIDELRGQGLNKYLPLPQLIVCGDQSSGKSSVLEAISNVPFPKKDNLCTRFATEVVLRKSSADTETRANVSILPGKDRSQADRASLRNFSKQLKDLTELPDAINEAKNAMGLGSQGSNAFSTDVLRLEVTGPRMPQLTIVDLPGLIHSENKLQTAQDVELVSELVKSYMAEKRSIILAVISAKNDSANQIVLKKARKEDPTGQRTLGIITKPDTLHPDSRSESAFLELARNTDVTFKLGWHVIRNLDSNENGDPSGRDQVESSFFQTSNWRTLDPSIVGASALRKRLSNVLFEQISHELPQLVAEIEKCRIECQGELNRLGRPRQDEYEQRHFLAELNQRANDLCRAGCNGNYDGEFFAGESDSKTMVAKRIRSILQNQGMDLAKTMKTQGARWIIRSEVKDEDDANCISRSQAVSKVVALLRRSRGRELPSTYNPMLISELFHEYCTPWHAIAKEYVFAVWQHAKHFMDLVLRYSADESVCELYTRHILYPEMDGILTAANKALAGLFDEMKSHASTFNNRFLEKVYEQQHEHQMQHFKATLTKIFQDRRQISVSDIHWVSKMLANEPISDMDRAAAEQILSKMEAYYQVALERFADNIPSLAVEMIIVQRLLDLFQPVRVWRMEAGLVNQIAGESAEKRAYRESLDQKLSIVRTGEAICKRYAAQAEINEIDSSFSRAGSVTPDESQIEIVEGGSDVSEDGSSDEEEEAPDAPLEAVAEAAPAPVPYEEPTVVQRYY